jgi:hypothetical protein
MRFEATASEVQLSLYSEVIPLKPCRVFKLFIVASVFVQCMNCIYSCLYYIVSFHLCRIKLYNMHGIKDDREDSDGEEMEHESGESDKSSSSCDSSDAPSDSDDSSGRKLLYNIT